MPTEAEYEAIIRRADVFFDAGKTEKAKSISRKGLKQAQAAGDDAFVHCFRGQLAILERNWVDYLQEGSLAVELNPHSPLLNLEYGTALGNLGRPEEALDYYNRALDLNPGYVPALRGRAAALHGLQRHEKALEDLNKAVELAPDDHRALQMQAIALGSIRSYEDALESAKKALEIQPESVNGLRVLAEVLNSTGRTQEARSYLQKAEVLNPSDPYVLRLSGSMLADEGKHIEALERFDAALRAAPHLQAVRLARALALDRLNRRNEAIAEVKALLAERPDDHRLKLWLFRLESPEPAEKLAKEQLEERQRFEQEEHERKIRLDAWRKLSARTAHRVDNQVFAARGAVRGLKADAGPELSEFVLDIEGSLERIGRICSEFRRFSTEQPPKLQPTDPRRLMKDAVRRYRKSAGGIKITDEIATLFPECRWDPQQIDQAVTELLENAIRHTAKRKKVLAKAEPFEKEGKQYVRIVVRNEGKGIDKAHKARVFEPFFSLRPGGTGLGLAIVSQIIENHGGRIRETGEPGKFARFEIELPAQQLKENSG